MAKQKAPGRYYRRGMTLVELMQRFPNNKAAEEWLISTRWPDGIRCPHCESENVQVEAKHPTMPHRCRSCRKYFSVRTGSVMQDSNISYQKWVLAFYLMNVNLKGVSSMRLHRELGLSQSSAWHLGHRIRQCWKEQRQSLDSSEAEVDEAYIGGLEKNKHAKKRLRLGRGTVGKTVVAGSRDRKSKRIAAEVVPDTKTPTLQGFVKKHVRQDGILYSDDAQAYENLEWLSKHEAVKHSIGEYVRDKAHTNGMESFWAVLKRGIDGCYHRLSPKHLQRYVDEFSGRHNSRGRDTIDQMCATVRGLVGKRLQYRELTRGGRRVNP